MHTYGFSTGALARGDFRRALELLAEHDVGALELSALRGRELPGLMQALPDLDISRYSYVSVHAPSRFEELAERKCASLLEPCIELGLPVVLHPDAIREPALWAHFGGTLCLENMDKRKPDGRTASELEPWFERYPEARFCLDLGHARQVDGSLIEARRLIRSFGDRLIQIHISELDVSSHHSRLSASAADALHEVAHLLPPLGVILESCVSPDQIDTELKMARRALEPRAPLAQKHTSTATA